MPLRIIQWATGAMGRTCLQAVIDSPATELVGLFVYDPGKVGKDAGAIARRDPTGVIATDDIAAILALEADVVLHCARIAPPYGSHDADIIRLLESGKNVISINGYTHPGFWTDARGQALAAACRKGGATLAGAGLNPGFAAEQLAVSATGLCSEFERLEVTESVDCRAVKSPAYVFDMLGFGSDPAQIDPCDPEWGPARSLNGMYAEALGAVALRLGLKFDRVERAHRAFAARERLVIAAGVIELGRVSHFNWRWIAHCQGGRELIMSSHWYMDPAHLAQPDPPLWTIHITGKPGVTLSVDLEKHPADTTRTTAEQQALAGIMMNTLQSVVDAAPGLMPRPVATPFRGENA